MHTHPQRSDRQTITLISAAYAAALDLAILGLRAGRSKGDVTKLAVARFKAVCPNATDADIARLTAAIYSTRVPLAAPTTSAAEKPALDSETGIADRCRRFVIAARALGIARNCVIIYVAFVVGSLFCAPWEGWAWEEVAGVSEHRFVKFTGQITRFGPVFAAPAKLSGSNPNLKAGSFWRQSEREKSTPPRLKSELLALLWGALGITTVAVLWMDRQKTTPSTKTNPST